MADNQKSHVRRLFSHIIAVVVAEPHWIFMKNWYDLLGNLKCKEDWWIQEIIECQFILIEKHKINDDFYGTLSSSQRISIKNDFVSNSYAIICKPP